ncbi:MAG TPA: CRTAC1 family protein [Thermoanaerobaculia bacterium]|nr:CRTAC1 family protein [Thermoanaerobaculia bacterium]
MHPDQLPLRRLSLPLACALALCALPAALSARQHDHGTPAQPAPAAQAAPDAKPKQILRPPVDAGVATLPARRDAQVAAAKSWKVFHDFRYTDLQPESGITFKHEIVDDAGKTYKAVHYDHGNGLLVADVDGDGLLDLYFLSQLGDNELWKNLGGGKFKDVTGEAGVAMPDRISVAGSFADMDNDGDADLYVTTVRKGNVLYENDGKGKFKDVTAQSGLGYVGHSSGSVFFDYDRDGLLDVFLVNVGKYTTEEVGRGGFYVGRADAFSSHNFPDRTELSRLYRNTGKLRFADVTEAAGIPDEGWAGDASLVDWDGDLWPDLYVLNMQGHNHYLENEGGKRFVDRTAAHFPKTSWGAMGIKWFDHDNDGLLDLLITDMHSDMSRVFAPDEEKLKVTPPNIPDDGKNVWGNSFYKNLGEGKFVELSEGMGLENFWPWGLSVGDLNADGFEDVFITSSMNYPFRYGINSLLLNDRGEKFLDAEFVVGVEPRRGGRTHTPWMTFDCAGADRALDLCKDATGMTEVLATLGSRASALFDLDRDGDLDIVTSDFNSEPQVFISDLAERKPALRWLEVDLRGTRSNRDGLGALVKVTAGGRTQTRQQDGKSGYLSQSVMPLYFGLGDAAAVEKVEVVWPSGEKQTVPGSQVKVNSTLEVVEPAAAGG